MTLRIIKRWLGYSGGLCDQVRFAAEDLSKTANELRRSVAIHERAPDPFASLLSTMWNNREIGRFPEKPIDAGQSGVYRRAPSTGRAISGH